MSEKDYTIAVITICAVAIFAPKSVALCFIVVAMAAAYLLYTKHTKKKP